MIELFGKQYNPYITNILVLYGYAKIHCQNMKLKKNIIESKKNYIRKELKKR